ncbi:hypothetical protein KCP69_24235 [Salmonella enterica subsp. enterica]|nr:hypothetical protein KCP69_24235 [Salmonella enterica subsp. enterica]
MSTTRDENPQKIWMRIFAVKTCRIAEDIIDSGNTLSKVREIIRSARAEIAGDLYVALDKPSRREAGRACRLRLRWLFADSGRICSRLQ